MKLLGKNEIQQKKATEKKREIEQGVLLARKVDDLRRASAEEERIQTKYREGTVEATHQAIASETVVLDQLRADIQEARGELEILREPLDFEWDVLAIRKEAVAQAEEKVIADNAALGTRESNVKKREADLDVEAHRIKDEKDRTSELLREAKRDSEQARSTRELADLYEEKKLAALSEREKSLDTREMGIKDRETDADNRTKNQDARDAELDARETRLASREETLTRNLNRYGTN